MKCQFGRQSNGLGLFYLIHIPDEAKHDVKKDLLMLLYFADASFHLEMMRLGWWSQEDKTWNDRAELHKVHKVMNKSMSLH